MGLFLLVNTLLVATKKWLFGFLSSRRKDVGGNRFGKTSFSISSVCCTSTLVKLRIVKDVVSREPWCVAIAIIRKCQGKFVLVLTLVLTE